MLLFKWGKYFECVLYSSYLSQLQFYNTIKASRGIRICFNSLYDLYTNHQQEILVTLCDLKGIFDLKLCYNNENLNNA